MTTHPITILFQLVICCGICGAVGYRIGLMPDSPGEDCASVILWVLALIGIVAGIAISIDAISINDRQRAERLAGRFTFWCGVALVFGHFIGAWP